LWFVVLLSIQINSVQRYIAFDCWYYIRVYKCVCVCVCVCVRARARARTRTYVLNYGRKRTIFEYVYVFARVCARGYGRGWLCGTYVHIIIQVNMYRSEMRILWLVIYNIVTTPNFVVFYRYVNNSVLIMSVIFADPDYDEVYSWSKLLFQPSWSFKLF